MAAKSPSIQDVVDRAFAAAAQCRTRLIAIDGCGGAGKSTLARRIRELAPTPTQIVEQDDFYLPSHARASKTDHSPGSDFDWPRVRSQILDPLSRDEPTRYQRYDWVADKLNAWVDIPIGDTVIVEGVYSARPELAPYYDFILAVETPHDLRLHRGLERDGQDARAQWEDHWMPAEEAYARDTKLFQRAHLTLRGY